jgi:hypothetical protein
MLNWPNQSCFLLVSDEILKHLVLIPALDSCKSQLLFTRRVNVDCLLLGSAVIC